MNTVTLDPAAIPPLRLSQYIVLVAVLLFPDSSQLGMMLPFA